MFKHIRVVTFSMGLLAGIGGTGSVAQAATDGWDEAEHAWQLQLLFEPGASQQKSELRGRIFIYSELKDSVVEQAMDEQFDRIEHMMFVRTVSSNADGEVEMTRGADGQMVAVIEEDGC